MFRLRQHCRINDAGIFSRDFYAEDNQSSSKKWKRQKKMGEGFIAHEYLPSTWVGPWGTCDSVSQEEE